MKTLWLGVCLAAGLSCPSYAQESPISATQKQVIETIIRDYLVNNPQVLREALGALERSEREHEEKSRAEAVAANAPALMSAARSAVLGNPKGDVTLVEFFDYNCGYCKRSLADVEQLLRSDSGLRLVLKEFPVLGRGSVEAAQISAQLVNHPRFAEFHVKLLSEKGQIDKKAALAVASSLGFDAKALEAGMNDKSSREVIEDSLRLADALNLNGTPTYIIGNEVVVGAVGIPALKAKIKAMRECGKATC